ncbi:MAG: hypothetical protein AAGI23_13575 [Bacteroidota bacterium]
MAKKIVKRKAYKSRRERSEKHWRNIRLTLLFVVIALGFVLYFNWRPITRWIGTYFY